ncbi:OmpA family protein [Flaviaesturariibacter terrae]
MSANVLESVKAFFNHEVAGRAAASLGESDSNVHKALSGIIPVILGSAVSKASSGDAGSVLDMAKSAGSGGLANTLKGLATGDLQSIISRGMDLVHGLFGSHAPAVNKSISGFSGVSEPSANSLMALVAPVALGKLGEHAAANNMNASSFASYLESQKGAIAAAVPAGLSLGSIPGLGTLGSWTGTTTGPTAATGPDIRQRSISEVRPALPDRNPSGNKWLLPLVLVIAALVLWYFLGKGCNKSHEQSGTSDTVTTVTPAPLPPDTSTTSSTGKTSTKVRLANGVELDAYAGGVEEQLVKCLDDAACKAGKDKWFDFDNINFEVGSARLTAESNAQINNIAAILNAYPGAHVKVGGYTDKTGNDAANKTLSQQRADAVLDAIKAAGGKAGQLTGAEGYGSAFAKVPATASDEERRKDRRIALQLNAK